MVACVNIIPAIAPLVRSLPIKSPNLFAWRLSAASARQHGRATDALPAGRRRRRRAVLPGASAQRHRQHTHTYAHIRQHTAAHGAAPAPTHVIVSGHAMPFSTWPNTMNWAARLLRASQGAFSRRGMHAGADHQRHQLVPGRRKMHFVNAPCDAVKRARHGRIGVGLAAQFERGGAAKECTRRALPMPGTETAPCPTPGAGSESDSNADSN